jgi:hypothetical protein
LLLQLHEDPALYPMREKDLAVRASPATLKLGNSERVVSTLLPYDTSGCLRRTVIPARIEG